MPTSPETLARQQAPARIPAALVEQVRRENGQCSGNCNQGRMCDCVADIDERDPMTPSDRAWIVGTYVVSTLAVLAALAAAAYSLWGGK